MKDLECPTKNLVEMVPQQQQQQQQQQYPTIAKQRNLLWRTGVTLCLFFFCVTQHWSSYGRQRDASSSSSTNIVSFSSLTNVKWHINPIKPLHRGKAVFLAEQESPTGNVVYKRIFTAPCAYGILVFSVVPADENLPYAYDLYDDQYVYSENSGLCILYPSYTGTQTSYEPLWTPDDPTEQTIQPLGDEEHKISARIVVPNNHANSNRKRAADFVIIRKGNFYNANYYKQLKEYINGWPADATTSTAGIDDNKNNGMDVLVQRFQYMATEEEE